MGAFAILGLAGAGLSAYGSWMQGDAQHDAANYNAALMEQQAKLVEQASASETELANERARELKASQRAAVSKAGARSDSGTPLLLLAEQAGKMQRDILEMRRNRAIEATSIRHGASMKRYEGDMAKDAARMNAFTTILGGTAQYGATKMDTFASGGGSPSGSSYGSSGSYGGPSRSAYNF